MKRSHPRPVIDVDELRAMLEQHQPVTVLDVRSAADRAEWSIPGSLHVDASTALKAGDRPGRGPGRVPRGRPGTRLGTRLGTAPDALAAVVLPNAGPVVTVCGAGNTSLVAAEQLRARGYDARSLRGGMKAWSLAWNSAAVPLPGRDTAIIQVRRTGKGCLSYLVGSRGEAVVIDAGLDPQVYVDLARRSGWTITHVLDTHVHADHLSRSRALAERTGATLVLPAQERVSFRFHPIRDGDILRIGNAAISAVATPGHTDESMSYLLDDRALLTGDTLFLDGVGRPDLEAGGNEARVRAGRLFRSLRRLMTLPPETIVLPGHTNAPVPFDAQPVAATLGEIIDRVEMLGLPEPAFVRAVLSRIPPTPPNHQQIIALNEAGALPEGDPTDLEAGANRCAVT